METVDFIDVKPHPINPDGWSIYKGEDMIKLLNDNFFLDRDHAEQVAISLRHVQMQKLLRQITGMNNLPSLK